MVVKAKDLKAGMVIELEMPASFYATKKKKTQTVEIEVDVLYEEKDDKVLVNYINLETKKGGVIILSPEQMLKLVPLTLKDKELIKKASQKNKEAYNSKVNVARKELQDAIDEARKLLDK